jgi:hypothetical protein
MRYALGIVRKNRALELNKNTDTNLGRSVPGLVFSFFITIGKTNLLAPQGRFGRIQ